MDEQNEKPELYHPDILAYAREPARWRKEHDAQYTIKAYNAVCGDKFEIRMDVDKVITNMSFFGYGCVVSKASIALLTEMIEGKSIDEARHLATTFIADLNNQIEDDPSDQNFAPFMVARKFPSRIQCATLGWEALLRSELLRKRKD